MKLLKGKIHYIVLYVAQSLIWAVLFYLYRFPMEALIYPLLLSGALTLALLMWSVYRENHKHRLKQNVLENDFNDLSFYPPADTLSEEDDKMLLKKVLLAKQSQKQEDDERYAKAEEFYAAWVHQIKTPISSMRLTLEKEDGEYARQCKGELNRIEQYVEMIMTYWRYENGNDYVFKEVNLDKVIEACVKRMSYEFIHRKLNLRYEKTDRMLISDEKWLTFVLEQVLSNALKYTQNGGIALYWQDGLVVEDSGIGIAPQDLKRIFDAGYTGNNGRLDRRSSGLGLSLCVKIMQNLGGHIEAESVVGQGTRIRLCFEPYTGVKE